MNDPIVANACGWDVVEIVVTLNVYDCFLTVMWAVEVDLPSSVGHAVCVYRCFGPGVCDHCYVTWCGNDEFTLWLSVSSSWALVEFHFVLVLGDFVDFDVRSFRSEWEPLSYVVGPVLDWWSVWASTEDFDCWSDVVCCVCSVGTAAY